MTTVVEGDLCDVCVPYDGLTENAVEIASKDEEGTPECTNEIYDTLQKIVHLWKREKISESYMALQVDNEPLQLIPYTKTESWFGRAWQQLQVLWRFTFGGWKLTPDRVKVLKETYADLDSLGAKTAEKVEQHAHCAFCQKKVIDSQLVLDGKRVQVLYNYAPIGLGGERLHFLIVSKRHCPTFHQLTKEEYQEAMELAQFVRERIQSHFKEEGKPIQKAYAYHKTGADAGQSVPHWHMHLVMTQNGAQEWLGKLTVLRNILIGSFKLSADALEHQRRKYTALLAGE